MLKKVITIVALAGLVSMGVGQASAGTRTSGFGHSFGSVAHHGGFSGVHFADRHGGFGRGFSYGDAMASAMIGVIAIGAMAAAANGS